MPIYEYACTACGHQCEVLQKISDNPLSDCPACHSPSLKKMISAAGFRLSGKGWYESDFKAKSDQKGLVNQPDSTATPASNEATNSQADASKSSAKTEASTAPSSASGAGTS